MEFFKDTHFEFMKHRNKLAVVSLSLAALSILAVFVHGKLNIGIDFEGGTQLILKFRDDPGADALRSDLAAAGIDAQIQSYGDPGSGEVIVRAPIVEGEEEGSAQVVLDALDAVYNTGHEGSFDLNKRGTSALVDDVLMPADPEGLARNDEALAREHYEAVAEQIVERRQVDGIFDSWDPITQLPDVGPEIVEALQERGYLGSYSLLGEEVVGPAIGAELRRKGMWAVVWSLIGILGYIWIRFELRFGVGALVALLHDVIIMLGIYAVADYEFNLSTIAAFLTLVGYSVNDTVVVFDRVRENMRRTRRQPLEQTIDESINQTLSRTVLTSGTTLLAVTALYFFGGEALRGFAFVIMIGVVIGTYSSIFVASPFTLLWEKLVAQKQARAKKKDVRPAA